MTNNAHERESRQSKSKPLLQRLRNIDREKSIALKIFLLFALVAVITLLAPSQNQLTFNYDVGTIWTHEDVIAPFSFPIYKNDAEYQKEIKQSAANVHSVYDRVEVENSRADSAVAVINQIQNAIRLHMRTVRDESKKTFAKDSEAPHALLQTLPFKFSDSGWHQLLSAANRNPSIINKLGDLTPAMRGIIVNAYQPGIIERPRDQIGSSIIVVREKNSETSIFTDQILTSQDVFNQLDQAASTIFKGDTASANMVSSAVAAQVIPNLTYDEAQTQREVNAAVRSRAAHSRFRERKRTNHQ